MKRMVWYTLARMRLRSSLTMMASATDRIRPNTMKTMLYPKVLRSTIAASGVLKMYSKLENPTHSLSMNKL